MSTPQHEIPRPQFPNSDDTRPSSEGEGTFVGEGSYHNGSFLNVNTVGEAEPPLHAQLSPSGLREHNSRLDDDLELLRVERQASAAATAQKQASLTHSQSNARSRQRHVEPEDAFDIGTTPLHEKTNVYRPPENPSTRFARFFKRVHESSFLVRYFTYITPVVGVLLIPLLLGALVFTQATVGGVTLLWFSIWLEIVWLTLWAGRIVAKCIPYPLGVVSSAFTNNSKKWRDLGKQLEVPATLFFWWLAIEVSFLPTMTNHHLFDPAVSDQKAVRPWEDTMNKVLVSIFAGTVFNFFEKICIQLVAISFHLRTYSDRIDVNKFQIASLTKLYAHSKEKIKMDDSEFEDHEKPGSSGAQTPMQLMTKAQKNAREALSKVGDAAGAMAGDFTGKQIVKRTSPHQVVLALLHTTNGSQVLARRLYRTFVRTGVETVYQEDLREAFANDDEADAAFQMFDKDLNGDISMEELESVCVEIGRERKSITASLKDLDSVVTKLDNVLVFFVVIVTLLIFLSLISASTASVLTSAGSTLLALSWLFSATAQEFLQSVIFVFVKHPFDVGDRVSIYGNTGALGRGDDYFVKEIALLYTEFKKMEGQVVQAPNSYLNTLFILNMRRSGGLAEGVPVTVKFGTSLEQIDALRQRLLAFVQEEKREFQGKILTELRDVTEAYSITLNVVFFYKSNWQNELLRLQRRNKFICAMMVCMQDLGFEGPRARIPGSGETNPMFVHNSQPPPQYSQSARSEDGPDGRVPRSGSLVRDAMSSHEAGRSGPSAANAGRVRGETMSAMSKRLDFSLGMRGMSSGDMMSDLYENDRSQMHLLPANAVANPSMTQPQNLTDEAAARSTSSDLPSGIVRRSTESQSRQRSTSTSAHRNRFFGRHRAVSIDEPADLESGAMADIPEVSPRTTSTANAARFDPRTGHISSQAVEMHSVVPNADGPPGAPVAASAFPMPPGSRGEDPLRRPQRSFTDVMDPTRSNGGKGGKGGKGFRR
ncbi:MAG: hypothetical protein M1838_001725 [Thelocarpon superellum]|nr:MAG: hypothetical protein M1838_001725 [Thelocarpon superellum]